MPLRGRTSSARGRPGPHVPEPGSGSRTFATSERAPAGLAPDARIEALLRCQAGRGGIRTVLGICVAEDPLVAEVLRDLGARPALPRVEATFLEDDAASAAIATARLRGVPGADVAIVHGDPGSSDSYGGVTPVDLALLGPAVVDGSARRRRGLAEALPGLLGPGGHLAWWSDRGEHLDTWHRALSAAGLVDVTVGPTWGLARLVTGPRRLQEGTHFYLADQTR